MRRADFWLGVPLATGFMWGAHWLGVCLDEGEWLSLQAVRAAVPVCLSYALVIGAPGFVDAMDWWLRERRP
jgi:hypothetical protein